MAYLLGLCAALCAATGAAVQHREVAEVPTASSTGLRLVIAALRRPLYLLGFAVLLGAFAFQFAALRVGDLTQVQPMLATELLFLMVIIVFTHHQRPGRREWAAAVMIVGGLALFLVAAKPHGGVKTLSSGWAVVLTIALVVVVGVLFGLSRLWVGWSRAALLGAAASSCFAYQAAMTKIVAGLHLSAIITSPALYLLGAGGALGFFLYTLALRAGHVAASRASMNIVNPLVSVLIGVVAFAEVLNHAPAAIVLEVLGLVILVFGARQMATSPLIATVYEDAAAS